MSRASDLGSQGPDPGRRAAFEPASETGLEGKAAPEPVTGIAL